MFEAHSLIAMAKNVVILLFDDVEVLDFAGPFEVFGATNELNGNAVFNLRTVSPAQSVIRAINGLKVVADHTLEDCPPPHVLIVPGGAGVRALLQQPAVLDWLRVNAQSAEIVASVCTGAFLLGKVGLLDGLFATTHHLCIDELRAIAPAAIVEPSKRYHDNGKVCAAAGISAGIDLSLHLIERLVSTDAAVATARYMEYDRGSSV